MKPAIIKFFFTVCCLVCIIAMPARVALKQACAEESPAPVSEVHDENTREASPAAIGFIDSPNVYCYQPDSKKDECYITWGNISVNAAPSYMIQLSIEIDDRIVAVNRGFFQTSMSIPADMNGNGFKVKCGRLGAGGVEDFGNAYPFIIRARDSGGLAATNYGTAYCPAHVKGK